MNRTKKMLTLSFMAVAMFGVVISVSPQLLAARAPDTDANAPAGQSIAPDAARSDLIDAYNWRLTINGTFKKT